MPFSLYNSSLLFIILLSIFRFFILSYFYFSLTIFLNSLLISRSMNVWDITVSTLFNFLWGSITTLLCFFVLFLVITNRFFIIPVSRENTRLKLGCIKQSFDWAIYFKLVDLLLFSTRVFSKLHLLSFSV